MNPLDLLLTGSLSRALGWTILHSLWQGMLIALFTAVLLLFLRHKHAAVRYRVAGISMLAVLVSAMLTFYWYTSDAPSGHSASTQVLEVELNMGAVTPAANQQSNTATVDTPSAGSAFQRFFDRLGNYFDPHLGLIVALWALGFGVYLLRLLSNIGQVYYLKTQRNFSADEYWIDLKNDLLQRAGINKAVELVESTLVRTPLVVGHLKPFIMFPIGLINRLDPQEVEAIIAHEIAHIVRRDYLFNILQSLIETIFYYHPAIWWLSSEMRREREIAADEMAIALTGNAINYAKALVIVQELAYYPMSPALAFAGPRKNQLLSRIERILATTTHSKYFAMEKFVSAGAFLLLIVGLALAQSGPNPDVRSVMPEATFTAADSAKGIWQAEVDKGRLCLNLSRKDARNFWNHGSCYDLNAFSALPNGQGSFTMTREAGVITFTGQFDGKEGFGRFVFAPNPSFRQMLDARGIKKVDDDMMIHFCLNNVTADFIDFLAKKGYKNIQADELVGLAIHGLDQKNIESYLDMFAQKGRKDVKLDDLMAFKIHDISEEYINSMSSLGFKNLSLDDIMAAKIHGIDAAYVQECQQMGFSGLDFENILAFKIHDVSPAYIAELKTAGISDLSAEDLLAFKIHEVSPAFVAEMKSAGISNLSNEDLLSFKIHGVTADYVANLKKSGMTNLDNDDILAHKIHDVSPEYAAQIRAAGFRDLKQEDLLAFKIHGITPQVIADLKKLFPDLGAEDVMALRIHGIDAAFIDGYKDIFNKKLTQDEVLSLKIHDVTPQFIRAAREKGFKDMDVDDFIQLKIQFGNKI